MRYEIKSLGVWAFCQDFLLSQSRHRISDRFVLRRFLGVILAAAGSVGDLADLPLIPRLSDPCFSYSCDTIRDWQRRIQYRAGW